MQVAPIPGLQYPSEQTMKQTLIYTAAAIAFAAAAIAFTQNATLPGILAVLAGVIAIAAALRWSEDR